MNQLIVKCLMLVMCLSCCVGFASEKTLPYKNFTPAVKAEQVKKLTPLQKYITQDKGTERAGSGEYDNFFEPGIYVDIVSGQPLFSSRDKYQANSGWPAFTKPINDKAVKIVSSKLWYGRERHRVASSVADSHLGDVFLDRFVKNPSDRGKVLPNDSNAGLSRYCIDSAALKFIPLKEMKKEGYGDYIKYVVPNNTAL